MKKKLMLVVGVVVALTCRADDSQLLRAKAELLVEQAGELLSEAGRKGSEIHTAAHKYYFGLMYGAGTNLLARAESEDNTRLLKQYSEMIMKDYQAYTKVEAAADKAAATGSYRGRSGSRQRASRMISAERLGEKELASAIKRWEEFVLRLKKLRSAKGKQ